MSEFLATVAALDAADFLIDRYEARRLEALEAHHERVAHEDEVADGLVSDPDYTPFDWAEEVEA